MSWNCVKISFLVCISCPIITGLMMNTLHGCQTVRDEITVSDGEEGDDIKLVVIYCVAQQCSHD